MSTEYKTFQIKTAAGKESKARGVNAEDFTVDGEKVTDAIKTYVIALAQEKSVKEEKEKKAKVIRTFAGKVRGYFIKNHEYQKTFRIFGDKGKKVQYAVDATNNDKWTVPKNKEDLDTLKEILGDKAFNQIFESSISIAVKKKVMENDALRKELSKVLLDALGKEGIKKYFDRDEVWKVKPGMAEDIHNFDPEIQKAFLEYIKQADDTIKDASEFTAE